MKPIILMRLLQEEVFDTEGHNITDSENLVFDTTFTNSTIITDPQIRENFLALEFLYLLLPCYFFCVVAFQRYSFAITQPKDDNNNQPSKYLHPSFYIKKWLSYTMSFLYMIIFGLSQFTTTKQIWTADFKIPSILYIAASISWFFSAFLLNAEGEKKLPQELYTHRLFWILSFLCNLIKIVIPFEHKIISNILNFIMLFITLVLTLYAIYKPYDTEELQQEYEPMPSCVKCFLSCLEINQITRAYIKDNKVMRNESSLLSFDDTIQMKDKHEMLKIKRIPVKRSLFPLSNLAKSDKSNSVKVVIHDMKETPQNTQKDMNLVNKDSQFQKKIPSSSKKTQKTKVEKPKLPEIMITLSKTMMNKGPNNEKNYYYQIFSSVDNHQTFTTEHKYNDFLLLESQLQQLSSNINQEIPNLLKTNPEDYPDDEKRFLATKREYIENFLNDIIKNPLLINENVLEFLGIKEPYYTLFVNNILQNQDEHEDKDDDNQDIEEQNELTAAIPNPPIQEDPKPSHDSKIYLADNPIDQKSCTIKIPTSKMATLNQETFIIYEVCLEILNPADKSQIKAQIRQYKRFKQFEKMHMELFMIYQPKEIQLPPLPPKYIFSESEPKERKTQLQNYCMKLLSLERITHQQAFQNFFKLNEAYLENGDETLLFDYCDLSTYDKVTDLKKNK